MKVEKILQELRKVEKSRESLAVEPGSARVGAGCGEEVMAHYGFTATKITRGGDMRRSRRIS